MRFIEIESALGEILTHFIAAEESFKAIIKLPSDALAKRTLLTLLIPSNVRLIRTAPSMSVLTTIN